MGTAVRPAGLGGLVPLLLWALVVGPVATGGAIVFSEVEHGLREWLWVGLPNLFEWDQPKWWWVLGVLLAGSALTYAAGRLPGGGGHSPLQGLSMDIGPREIVSVLLAALASLSFGAVLGPEAPLLAIGTAIGYSLVRKQHPQRREILMLAGAMAAISFIFGNPLVVAILLLEMAVLGGMKGPPMLRLLPALIALGSGYVVQVGTTRWEGIGTPELSVPGLPAYPNLAAIDVLVSLPLAIVVGLLVVAAYRAAEWSQPRVSRRPLAALLAGALVVAAAALIGRALTGEGVEYVLFSGQQSIPGLLTMTSVGTVLVIVVTKTVAYSASLGVGFRGGPVFPAVFLGIGMGVITTQLITGTSLAALTAAGIAAATAAALRLPFTAVLMAVLLTAGAGLAVTSPAVLGSVIGVLIRVGLDARSQGSDDDQDQGPGTGLAAEHSVS